MPRYGREILYNKGAVAQEGKRLVRPAQGVPPQVPQGVRLNITEILVLYNKGSVAQKGEGETKIINLKKN